ncbi:thioredoxin family protein [Oculatella sp. LEGE 06141]|uniref:thioredoxin family protein n=1 Tax=Oculatella sp. LEGE 06141 TaxID=1828648 RepID=UPI001882726A|nr:thioredoxin family protein [Oculatella sp. LEGE 06141]MBE9177545.1 thioredoxin family protein [Oculatella sp. LEGE 06141]
MTVNPNSAPTPNPQPDFNLAARIRNLVIVLVAIALSTAVFFGLRTETNSVSLSAMAEAATPMELALTNHKPTLLEFYANWCTTCQAMAEDLDTLKQEYGDRVNFVMLNVDNNKWLPELLHYRVDGIPHFVYLDEQGEAIASAIGEQPKSVMAANLDALATGQSLPYLQTARGKISEVEPSTLPKTGSDDPRSHGSQVVQ